jgi:general stress protein 26
MTNHRTEAIEKLKGFLEGIDFTMLTTISDGRFHSRPMSTQEMDENGDLWFFTQDDSRKIEEIQADNRINAAYSDPDGNTFISVFGRADVVKDRAKIEELWSPIYRAWFPEGLDDPHICLLRVHVEDAEYWDAPNSKIVQIAGFVKALVTGTEADIGDHGTVKVNPAGA